MRYEEGLSLIQETGVDPHGILWTGSFSAAVQDCLPHREVGDVDGLAFLEDYNSLLRSGKMIELWKSVPKSKYPHPFPVGKLIKPDGHVEDKIEIFQIDRPPYASDIPGPQLWDNAVHYIVGGVTYSFVNAEDVAGFKEVYGRVGKDDVDAKVIRGRLRGGVEWSDKFFSKVADVVPPKGRRFGNLVVPTAEDRSRLSKPMLPTTVFDKNALYSGEPVKSIAAKSVGSERPNLTVVRRTITPRNQINL